MLDAFRDHLNATGLVPPGARVLVGYSGGADSTCLLHLLSLAGVDVVAGHLHHGQRPEAETELKLCEAFASELGVPFVSGRADVPRMARDLGIGLEEAGREARYGFFRQAAYQLECDLIATAHTRTDHVETIVFHLARGTGLSGLGGIPVQRENIVRPLMAFTREETRRYCEQHNLWFHDDPANVDVSFARARIRHRILPELRSVNPRAEEALVRMSSIVQEEDAFLNAAAAAALERSETPLNGELRFLTEDVEVAFSRGALAHLPPVLMRRSIRLAVEALGAGLDYDQTLGVLDGLVSSEKGSITAEGGEVVVEWSLDSVVVRRLAPPTPFRYGLTVPGETISDEFGWRFTAYEEPYHGVAITRASLETAVDAAKVKGTLYFRTAGSGDRMQPLGFQGHRRLADLLAEADLTAAARARLPIVCDMLGPIWAPGVCLDERVRAGEGTEGAIRMSFGPLRQDR